MLRMELISLNICNKVCVARLLKQGRGRSRADSWDDRTLHILSSPPPLHTLLVTPDLLPPVPSENHVPPQVLTLPLPPKTTDNDRFLKNSQMFL